jgi:hypothetical protein
VVALQKIFQGIQQPVKGNINLVGVGGFIGVILGRLRIFALGRGRIVEKRGLWRAFIVKFPFHDIASFVGLDVRAAYRGKHDFSLFHTQFELGW